MLISLHKQATTTLGSRAAIPVSAEPASMLAERYATSEQTAWKRRERAPVHDRSQTPHRLQTTLSPAQKGVAVAQPTTLLLHRDDLRAAARAFLDPNDARSGLDRCLSRGRGRIRLTAMGQEKTSQSRTWK